MEYPGVKKVTLRLEIGLNIVADFNEFGRVGCQFSKGISCLFHIYIILRCGPPFANSRCTTVITT